jgi:hypothetical protein
MGRVLGSEAKPPVRLMQVALLVVFLPGLGYNGCREGGRIPLHIIAFLLTVGLEEVMIGHNWS